MRRIFDLTTLAAALLVPAAGALAQTPPAAPPAPAEGTASFTIFAGATAVGSEEITVTRAGDGWRISSNGEQRFPAAMTINHFEVTYAADWHPREMRLDAVVRNQGVTSTTSFGVTTAVTDVDQAGRKASLSHEITPRTIVLPNGMYAAYEAFAVRLAGARAGDTFHAFVVPQTEVTATVKNVREQNVSTLAGDVPLTLYDLEFANPDGRTVPISIEVDGRHRLARIVVAGQLTIVRSDLASVTARTETWRNPGDENVLIPANGFNLAGTVTLPPQAASTPVAARREWPAIVLIAGSGPQDRDQTVAGIPIFGQLAGQLAEAGFIVVRYDKRGVGQSGGRPEAATLDYYAEDARAAVRWLADRDDVDEDRIAVVGHSEGAAVAMLLADKENKVDALVLIAGPGTTGYDLVLEQQAHAFEQAGTDAGERDAKVAIQRRLMDAVIGKGSWDDVPEALRRSADSPWFRSFLLFDPAKAMKEVDEPIMVISASRDTQVPPHHGENLAALANARRGKPATPHIVIEGVNHLLVPAKTGEVSEYASLSGSRITPDISREIAGFLNAAFALR